MAQYDGSIRIDTKIDTRGLKKGEADIRSSSDRILGTAKKIAGAIGAAFAVGKIIQFGKEVLQVASDFEAMESQFSQAFGDLESDASRSLSNIAKQAGIAEERMKSSYTKIAAFAKTAGMSNTESMKLADRAMVAVADSAAFYDRSLEETTESLQSFLKGNYENDAALGLSATEFTRNAAANKLYGKSFIELSEAQKQLTLLSMVEDANKLSGALGQASRESDTWANQTGNLSQALLNLKSNIGRFILPIAIEVVKKITNIINAINNLLSKLGTLLNLSKSIAGAISGKKPASNTANEYNKAADAAQNLADSTENVSDATKKAAKETKKALAPFDDLRQIRFEEAEQAEDLSAQDTGIGTGIDFGQMVNVEKASEEIDGLSSKFASVIDAMKQKAKELKDIFMSGFWDGLGDYKPRLEELKSDLQKIGGYMKDIFTDSDVMAAAGRFVNSFVYAVGTYVGMLASIGLTIATNIVGGIESYLSKNVERIKKWLVRMFDIGTEITEIYSNFFIAFGNIFSAFASQTAQDITGTIIQIFADVYMGVLEISAKIFRDVSDLILTPIVENQEKIKQSILANLEVINTFIQGVASVVRTTIDSIVSLYNNSINPIFVSVRELISELLATILDGYNQYIIPVLDRVAQKFKEVMEGAVGDAIRSAINFIGTLIDKIYIFWENVLSPLLIWISGVLVPAISIAVSSIGTQIQILMNYFQEAATIISAFFDVISGLIDFIVGVFTGDWEKAWGGIKNIFESIWDAIVNIIKIRIDSIKTIILGAIDIFKRTIDSIRAFFEPLGEMLADAFSSAEKNINSVLDVLDDLISFIRDVFTGNWENAWNTVKKVFEKVWNGIKSTIRKIKDDILSIIKDIVSSVKEVSESISGIFSGKQKSSVSGGFGGGTRQFSARNIYPKAFSATLPYKIPALATGTVVPPNREFLATLGDNKREPEVVSPISTMKQAFMEALAESGISGGGQSDRPIYLQLDGKTLARLMLPYTEAEKTRVGVRMVTGNG